MATFLFDEHVFGPIKSRRYGNSLGINLLATDHKVCNYDCIYCECGLSPAKLKKKDGHFVSLEELDLLLAEHVKMNPNETVDAITFAGNGEPTLHPKFDEVVNLVRDFRDIHYPHSKLVLLTNGTKLRSKRTNAVLPLFDTVAIKLDAGTNQLVQAIDHPRGNFSLEELVSDLCGLPFKFTIQSMFLKGTVNGQSVDNTTEENLESWLRLIQKIKPKLVSIYSISRDTAMNNLSPVSKETLQTIGKRIERLGIPVEVS